MYANLIRFLPVPDHRTIGNKIHIVLSGSLNIGLVVIQPRGLHSKGGKLNAAPPLSPGVSLVGPVAIGLSPHGAPEGLGEQSIGGDPYNSKSNQSTKPQGNKSDKPQVVSHHIDMDEAGETAGIGGFDIEGPFRQAEMLHLDDAVLHHVISPLQEGRRNDGVD